MMEYPESTSQKRGRSLGFEESGSKRRNTADGPTFESESQEPCKDFARGICDRGASCKYAHVPPADKEVCHDFLAGKCYRRPNGCKFFHDYDQLREREMQRGGNNMVEAGGASNPRAGMARVIYEDGTEEWVQRERIKPDAVDGGADDREVCHDYQRGICMRGRSCKFRHSIEKCREFAAGSCRRGSSCKFAHGEKDRRSSSFLGDWRGPDFPPSRREGRSVSGEAREVCREFLRGYCSRGRDCRFSHNDGRSDSLWGERPRGRDRDWGSRGWSGREDPWREPLRGGRRDWGSRSDFDDGWGIPRRPLCNDYQRGKCSRGRACKYSHDVPPREVCREFTRGSCSRGETCKYDHPMPEICHDFTRGKCDRGEDCKYSHEPEEEGASRVRARPAREVCKDYTRGNCTRGESCKYSHDVDEEQMSKREVCIDFTRGRCSRGEDCKYVHQTDETEAMGAEGPDY